MLVKESKLYGATEQRVKSQNVPFQEKKKQLEMLM
jgi:hypothetical protein